MELLSVFAVTAVFLAGVGIYGVMSFFVSQHIHDVGVRIAVGASSSNILGWITRLGMTIVGIAIGVALAIGSTCIISAGLFGVTPTDPLTYFAVSVALAAVALLACYIPARRATRVGPMVALRYE